MNHEPPKALTLPEACSQVVHAWWRLVETIFEPTGLDLAADRRAVQAWTDAVHNRACAVGLDQARTDYL